MSLQLPSIVLQKDSQLESGFERITINNYWKSLVIDILAYRFGNPLNHSVSSNNIPH